LESVSISGTPASVNCLSSPPCSFPFAITCPYARASLSIGTESPADTSPRAFIVGIRSFTPIPIAKSCFAFDRTSGNSKGVLEANTESSFNSCFASSALPSIVSNEIVACSSLSASPSDADHILYNPVAIAPPARARRPLLANHDIASVALKSLFQIPLSISIPTCLNNFPSTDNSLSPVRTKFVSSRFNFVTCFACNSIALPRDFPMSDRFIRNVILLYSFLIVLSFNRASEISIAIFTDTGFESLSSSFWDCLSDCWSTLVTTSACICSFAIIIENIF